MPATGSFASLPGKDFEVKRHNKAQTAPINAVVLRILTRANCSKGQDAKLRACLFFQELAAEPPPCDDTEGESHAYSCILGCADDSDANSPGSHDE